MCTTRDSVIERWVVQVARGSDDSDRPPARFSDPGLLALILADVMYGPSSKVDLNHGLSAQYPIYLFLAFDCL